MRWLFLFVLFLNLAYIAWEMNKPSPDPYAYVAPVKNTQSIVLLSEVTRQQPVEVAQDQAEEVLNLLAGNEHDDSALIDSAKVDSVQDGSVEVDSVQHGGSVREAVLLSPKVQPQKKNDSCFTLGPFRELEVLRALIREIKSYVVTVDFRGSEVNEPSLYWVYIKPEQNHKNAIATGNRLKANKIKDYFIITKGEKINGISLGYFKNKNGAQRLQQRAKRLGFNVVLESVLKSHAVYWLDYQVSDGMKIPDAILNKYINAAKKDEIERLPRDCVK